MSSSMQLPAGLRPAPPPSSGNGGPGGAQGAAGGPSQEEQAARQAQEDEMRRGILSQVLEPEARERLSRISLVRPQTTRQIEDLLMRMARSGQLRGKVGDGELKGLLEQVSAESAAKVPTTQTNGGGGTRSKSLGGGITIQRKRDQSDSDEYDL